MNGLCPCDPKHSYGNCCGALHAGTAAADAEALMRSRYSAYVLGDRDYLLASWHPSTRPLAMDLEGPLRWLRLKVLAHRRVDDTHAEVDFEAKFIDRGRHGVLRERSRFVREGGRWFYVDGDLG